MNPHACRFAYCAAPSDGRFACGLAKLTPWPPVALGLHRLLVAATLAVLAWLPADAQAQTRAQNVALAGMLGGKALLVVDGAAPKTVAAGETHQETKVISTLGDQAVIEQSGKW